MSRKDRKKNKKNNKGFSLFTVIVAVSFVSILGLLVLYIALNNFQMKVTDLKGKDSFYKAERALEEIRVGLQTDVGEAMAAAYIKVLETYSEESGSAGPSSDVTLNERKQAKFKNLFVEELSERLKDIHNSDYYAMEPEPSDPDRGILRYLDISDESQDIFKPEKESLFVTNPAGKDPRMVKDLENGIILRNLMSVYVDEYGRASIIETDIHLGIPQVQFPTASTLPERVNTPMYFVAQDGLVCEGNGASEGDPTEIIGEIYAGNKKVSITVEELANLKVSGGKRLVCQGNIDVQKNGKFESDSQGKLWARGIDVASGEVSLLGKTYLADDLTVGTKTGNGSKVIIKGEYYGYGSPETAKASENRQPGGVYASATDTELSSAITINGKNTILDLSGANKIMLAGKNYIKSPDKEPEHNTVTGESLTVKGTQLAYLVPDELIGDGTLHNPIQWKSDEDTVEIEKLSINANLPVKEWGGKTLSEIGVNSDSPVHIVYQPGFAYFYLNFDERERKAAEFMQMYYANNPQVKRNMDKYLGYYFDEGEGIKERAGESYLKYKYETRGNILIYDGDLQEGILGSATQPESGAKVKKEQLKFQNIWYYLNRKMVENEKGYGLNKVVTNSLGEPRKESEDDPNQTVFDNWVNEKEMVEFLQKKGEQTHSTPPAENGNYAVFTNTSYTIDSSNCDNLKLLVCTGDVNVQKDFNGIIMAKGKIILSPGVTLVASSTDALKVFQNFISEEKISPKTIFWDGNNMILGNVLAGDDGDFGTMLSDIYNLAECVTYENWKKK